MPKEITNNAETALQQVQSPRAAALLPALTLQDLSYRAQVLDAFISRTLKDGVDYDVIPGTPKPSLLQPGAEKCQMLFGWTPKFVIEEKIEQWDEPAFFYYRVTCQIWAGDRLLGDRQASCNSHESKYRYRWVPEAEIPPYLDRATLIKRDGILSEPQFAVAKGETQGKYGKPAEYWQQFKDAIAKKTARQGERETAKGGKMLTWEIDGSLWRVPNPDIADQHNTIIQMAQKRAHVAAIKMVANLSERFTMDQEEEQPPVYQGESAPPLPLDIPEPKVAKRQAAAQVQSMAGSVPPEPLPSMRMQSSMPTGTILAETPQQAAAMNLQSVLASLTSRQSVIDTFVRFKAECLDKVLGNSDAVYTRILGQHGVETAGDLKSPAVAKACFTDLWNEYQVAKTAPPADDAWEQHVKAEEAQHG